MCWSSRARTILALRHVVSSAICTALTPGGQNISMLTQAVTLFCKPLQPAPDLEMSWHQAGISLTPDKTHPHS
eukprot:2579932-Rhodomonas_salina.6